VLTALATPEAREGLVGELQRCVSLSGDGPEGACAKLALATVERALRWLNERGTEPALLEAGARRLSLTLARATALGLLASHAAWSRRVEGDPRALYSAQRFSTRGVDVLGELELEAARALAMDLL
jgi:hypothetical protein